MHPAGGFMTSYADLRSLAIRYKNGYINSDDFIYGVVSEYGCIALTISSWTDFEKFATLLQDKDGDLIKGWDEAVRNWRGTSLEERLDKYSDFLQERSSGLSVLFAPMGGIHVLTLGNGELYVFMKRKSKKYNIVRI